MNRQASTLQRAVTRETGPAGPNPRCRCGGQGRLLGGSDVYTATWPNFTAEAEEGDSFLSYTLV